MKWNQNAGMAALAIVLSACGQDGKSPVDEQPSIEDRPASPVALNVVGEGIVSERYTAEVAAREGWAYTSTWGARGGTNRGNVIKIWNVSSGVSLVDSLVVNGASTTGDVEISPDGKLLMVATEFSPGSVVLYDRTTPSKPVELSRFSNANTQPGVHTAKFGTVNGKLYGFLSVDPNGTVPARLVIIDLSNASSPVEVWSQVMGRPYVHDVFVRDGLLFTALWDDGMSIWDIGGGGRGGTPSSPVLISNVQTATGNIHNIWWVHDPRTGAKKYVLLGEEGFGSVGTAASGDIHVIDIADITQPKEVATYAVTGAGTHNFWVDEPSGYAYAAYYNGGVRAIDVRGDLSSCTSAQRTPAGLCDLRLMGREVGIGLSTDHYVWGVVHEGTKLYASDMLRGLIVLDASGLKR